MKSFHKISSSNIHICFLGCGKICNSHVGTLRSIQPEVKISFASREKSKAEEYNEKHKGQMAFDSYDSAIADEDVNVIFITTPPDSHYDLTKKAIQHGKHVILEKPPFFSSHQMYEMGMLSDENKLQLLIAENYFYKPLLKKLKSLLEEDVIGKALIININAMKKQVSNDWRADENVCKFGALFEGGIHWVNFINNLGLNLNNVTGFFTDKSAMDKTSQLVFKGATGIIVNLFYSWEVNTIFKGLRLSKIFGSEGSITFESNGLFILLRGKRTRIIFPGLKDITGRRLMLADFMNSIESGTSPQLTWQIATQDLVYIEKAYEGIES